MFSALIAGLFLLQSICTTGNSRCPAAQAAALYLQYCHGHCVIKLCTLACLSLALTKLSYWPEMGHFYKILAAVRHSYALYRPK